MAYPNLLQHQLCGSPADERALVHDRQVEPDSAMKVFIAALAIVVVLQLLAWAFGYRKGVVEYPD